MTPASQTAVPGTPVTYNVTISNTNLTATTFSLSVTGISKSWVSPLAPVSVPGLGSLTIPIKLTSDAFAALGNLGFAVIATAGNSSDSVQGNLILQGVPPKPDPQSHGVAVTLVPASATAGQGTSAGYVVRVTNTGSVAETFRLSIPNLQTGFVATFAQTDIVVPPGASNFREVPFFLKPSTATAATTYSFTVKAVALTNANVNSIANGSVIVLNQGVDVDITSATGLPGGTLQLLVKNTGRVSDTFDLTLGGAAGLVSKLGATSVTLAPGASQLTTINVGNIDFADPGSLLLSASAKSRTNSTVLDSDTANISIAGSQRVTATFVLRSKPC